MFDSAPSADLTRTPIRIVADSLRVYDVIDRERKRFVFALAILYCTKICRTNEPRKCRNNAGYIFTAGYKKTG